MLFAELARVSAVVAATSKRTEKVAALAALLRSADPGEVAATVGFLTGSPRQGRIGVGWASLRDLRAVAETERLTVDEVDETIEQLARTSGTGSVQRRQQLLTELFDRATAAEGRLLWALLTGELRQGALDGVMTDAVAKAAGVPLADVRRAAMLSGSLAVAASIALGEGVDALRAVEMEVLRPVHPMLAATAASVAAAITETGPAAVEYKLDGARVQVHREGDVVRVFTRNLNEVTDRLPLIVEAALGFDATSFVLDGEALGVDDEGRPLRFQDTMSSFGADAAGTGAELRAYFLDLLTLDGVSLLAEPLGRRRELLAELVGRAHVPGAVTDDPDVAARVLEDSLRTGHEGVVVKALSSVYDAGRRGGAWRKVKPVRTFDLVVLAAEWGHGRRTGSLSNLHLGALDPEGAFGEAGGFVMVGKTFKGLTDQLLAWQTAALQAIATSSDGYVVHVRPELVVEIAIDGVQVSRRYPGGVALRFARVKAYRPDKTPAEADTIEALRELLRVA